MNSETRISVLQKKRQLQTNGNRHRNERKIRKPLSGDESARTAGGCGSKASAAAERGVRRADSAVQRCRASLPYSMRSYAGRSNGLPCACGCKCCTRLVLHARRGRGGGVGARRVGAPTPAIQNTQLVFQCQQRLHRASEIRGRVSSTARGLPPT